MDDRKRRILQAIIEDYVLTAEPVGSRTIARKYLPHLSSATIRNEMSDLEVMGYLEQPHISAGRIPNVQAYRLYVDGLLDDGLPPIPQDSEFQRQFLGRLRHLDDVAGSAAQALSELTQYAALVMTPGQQQMRIATLQLVPVSRAVALLVIVTDGGIIRDTLVHVSQHLDADALYAISRMLTERFAGKTLGEVQTALKEFASYQLSDPQVLEGVVELAAQMEKQSAQDVLMVSGTHNMLGYPEYQDAEKAKQLLSALDDKPRLLHLIRDSHDLKLTVLIGSETGIPEMGDCSLALAEYRIGSGERGAIGIIGPTRMPYAQVFSTLRLVSQVFGGVFHTGQTGNDTWRTQ